MSSTAESEVLFNRENSAKDITFNRAKALNALLMVRQIYPKMKEWMIDENAGLVFIKGAGDKAFCVGGDVLCNGNVHKEFFREEYILNYLIRTYKLRYIALIDGITMGGGCGLSIHGKFRVGIFLALTGYRLKGADVFHFGLATHYVCLFS
uniref:3-hydroxyisobutyryl-CoA hydrolase, mitochondrial n=1 Tax=Panagrolaimus davidi TaxID=227884 RepID=A0A914PJU7_9BILA